MHSVSENCFHQAVQYRTDQIVELRKVEQLNNRFFALMARGADTAGIDSALGKKKVGPRKCAAHVAALTSLLGAVLVSSHDSLLFASCFFLTFISLCRRDGARRWQYQAAYPTPSRLSERQESKAYKRLNKLRYLSCSSFQLSAHKTSTFPKAAFLAH